MARKFSFNLAPVKIASKQDLVDRPTPEPTPSHTSSATHRRHTSKDSICDNSPWINRRALDGQTEQELRSACRLILQNFKPSDHGMENTDPKLDFGGLRPRKESRPQPADVNVRMPTGAPAELASTSFLPRTRSTKTRTRAKADQEIRARQYADLPARANSSRKRADFAWLDERDADKEEKLRTLGKASIDLPRSALRNDSDEDITLPVAVASNFANSKLSSSVPTSASLPTARLANRRSHQFEDPALAADAQAAEWMRAELEKRQQQESTERQGRTSTSVRPPSRAASIKETVKEYVFPGSRSRALSRAQSKDSLRSPVADDDQRLSRHGSNSGWRSWGLRRGKSMRTNSRPGSLNGQSNEPAQSGKSESNGLNLNRELPPLPSLDSWKEPEKPKEDKVASPKSPIAETHIASLMLSQDRGDRSPAARNHHRKSGSDTLAMQPNTAFPVRKSSRKQETHAIAQPTRVPPASPGQAEHMTTALSSTTNIDPRLERNSGTHTLQRSGHGSSAANSHRSAEASSFSHKISLDSETRKTTSSEPKTPVREEQKSKLKKIFTGWMHKKDKKEDWMQRMEKDSIKEGVLVQEGDALASPVVRY
ncbi:hypothetical protein DDE82_002465 [Stemphylium lycopersici]|nr:hypothetical protein TW65_07878 [Stemphylium lycopersici]RAR08133.1 hypothetical protein DDE82_002465 [Stemphylium lycopersici]